MASALTESPAEHLFALLRSRRVTRAYSGEPVSVEHLRAVVEAGARATRGGNRDIKRFLVVHDPKRMALLRTMSPGMLGYPTAAVVLCTDLERAEAEQTNLATDRIVQIDVGMATMNMMLAAHALGLGSCPLTSYSRAGVRAVLGLPDHAVPEFIVQLGHRRAAASGGGRRPARPVRRSAPPIGDVVFWDRYGQREDAGG